MPEGVLRPPGHGPPELPAEGGRRPRGEVFGGQELAASATVVGPLQPRVLDGLAATPEPDPWSVASSTTNAWHLDPVLRRLYVKLFTSGTGTSILDGRTAHARVTD